jgi:hypothetical protein
MSGMVFKIYFFVISMALLSSCKEKSTTKVITPIKVSNSLLEIKKVKRIVFNNKFPDFDLYDGNFYKVTIKNISGFDLYHHHFHGEPMWVSEAKNLHYPGFGTHIYMEDTYRIVKADEEFIVVFPFYMPSTYLYEYEYQDYTFQLLISAEKDLSPYLEKNPSKFKFRTKFIDDGTKRKFGYCLEFKYWTSCGFFWENIL